MGKGDTPRPSIVSAEEFEKRWNLIDWGKKDKEVKQQVDPNHTSQDK